MRHLIWTLSALHTITACYKSSKSCSNVGSCDKDSQVNSSIEEKKVRKKSCLSAVVWRPSKPAPYLKFLKHLKSLKVLLLKKKTNKQKSSEWKQLKVSRFYIYSLYRNSINPSTAHFLTNCVWLSKIPF